MPHVDKTCDASHVVLVYNKDIVVAAIGATATRNGEKR